MAYEKRNEKAKAILVVIWPYNENISEISKKIQYRNMKKANDW